MWRPHIQHLWLGDGSHVTLGAGRRLSLRDEGSLWRNGRINRPRGTRLIAVLNQPVGRIGDSTQLVVSVGSGAAGASASVLSIEERGLPDPSFRAEAAIYWAAAISRLLSLVSSARRSLADPRQAVIVIHGIGEQRPGRTLRDFVKAGLIGPDNSTRWIKPDRDSALFDVRRVAYRAGPVTPRTDVFELYWAHMIGDTTVAQVSA